MRTLLVQPCFPNPVLAYLMKCWEKVGFARFRENCLEIPTWMAHAAPRTGEVLTIFPDCSRFPIIEKGDVVMGSVMDASLPWWKECVRRNGSTQFVLGGYVDSRVFYTNPRVVWMDSLPEEVDYSLFHGQSCIPRLTLSRGCPYPCSFCTVPRVLAPRDGDAVLNDVEKFRPLSFRHIYIDDKTFGLSPNYTMLPEIMREVRQYNPQFEGFIVQTTVKLADRMETEFAELGVKYVEVGVETLDDKILREWRKPHTSNDAWGLLHRWKGAVGLIPNIVVGGPNQSYEATAAWLIQLKDKGVPFANFYTLSVYPVAQHVVNLGHAVQDGDSDENSLRRSWLSLDESEFVERWRRTMMEMFLA